jgi:hypothetical protein
MTGYRAKFFLLLPFFMTGPQWGCCEDGNEISVRGFKDYISKNFKTEALLPSQDGLHSYS